MIRLGSNSKTRASILKNSGIEFIQSGGSFDEDDIKTVNPKEFVLKATQGKFEELYEKFGIKQMPLLVADTVVTSSGRLLRKPKDLEDARRMLLLQSGSETTIITCMVYLSKELYLFDISSAAYCFSEFDKDHLDRYVSSQKCMGKAGAIMVEGFCKPYIKWMDGYESTAMGLCVEKLLPFVR